MTMRRATATGEAETSETISLDYGSRHLRRKGLTTDQGRPFVLDLAEPTDLRDGDALLLDDGGAIRVVAAPEPLAEVRATGRTLARLAWHVGNRHTPCEVRDDRLLIQRDHVLEDMLQRLGADVFHVEAPFQPEGGAYGHGRTHGHSHAHNPHEDPNAAIPHRRDRPHAH